MPSHFLSFHQRAAVENSRRKGLMQQRMSLVIWGGADVWGTLSSGNLSRPCQCACVLVCLCLVLVSCVHAPIEGNSHNARWEMETIRLRIAFAMFVTTRALENIPRLAILCFTRPFTHILNQCCLFGRSARNFQWKCFFFRSGNTGSKQTIFSSIGLSSWICWLLLS